MRVQIKLVEATPNTLWTLGEIKNLSAAGHPTVTPAEAALGDGTRFVTTTGLHCYRFLIKGDGAITIQVLDADTGTALAVPGKFDTTVAHGGHAYTFGVP